MTGKFWTVWRTDGRVPKFKHATLKEARDEASRLAKENPGALFYVLETVGFKYKPALPTFSKDTGVAA